MSQLSDRFTIHTSDLNKHCRIPGNPFVSPTVLHPNSPNSSPPSFAMHGKLAEGTTIRFAAEAFNPRPENPGAMLVISLNEPERPGRSLEVSLAPRILKDCALIVPNEGAIEVKISVKAPPSVRSQAHTGVRIGPISFGQILAGEVFEPAVIAVGSRTLLDTERLRTLWSVAKDVEANSIGGDFVECGAYRGGSAGLLGLASLNGKRKLWLYDSFEGMPIPTTADGQAALAYAGKLACSPEEISVFLSSLGIGDDRVRIVPGWFKDSFQNTLPESISILHCDADWYESVKLVLETMYPRVSDGGYVVLDDFGYWEGCRAAFYDFCKEAKIAPLLERTGPWQAHWQKGREHNRKVK